MFDFIKSKLSRKKKEEQVIEEEEPIIQEKINYVYEDGTPASKEDIAALSSL
jgi:hypothetical protein